MDLFDTLHEQVKSVRLPLFAVTVTAAAQVNTPLVAILHWHGFRPRDAARTTGKSRTSEICSPCSKRLPRRVSPC